MEIERLKDKAIKNEQKVMRRNDERGDDVIHDFANKLMQDTSCKIKPRSGDIILYIVWNFFNNNNFHS